MKPTSLTGKDVPLYTQDQVVQIVEIAIQSLQRRGEQNNPRMNLRKSTAIVHRGGRLRVMLCDFRGAAQCEKLYEGSGKNVEWISSEASGGAGMAADAARLSNK